MIRYTKASERRQCNCVVRASSSSSLPLKWHSRDADEHQKRLRKKKNREHAGAGACKISGIGPGFQISRQAQSQRACAMHTAQRKTSRTSNKERGNAGEFRSVRLEAVPSPGPERANRSRREQHRQKQTAELLTEPSGDSQRDGERRRDGLGLT